MKYLSFFAFLVSIGILIAVLSTSNIAFSSSVENNTVLEQAQKALEANQKQPTSNMAPVNGSEASSKIIRSTGSMSTYENSDYGIRINFPNTWKPSEVNLDTYVIVMFFAPEMDPSSADYVFQPAYLSVVSQKLPSSNTTLSEFVKSIFRDFFPNATEYKIISTSKSNLGGMESEKIIMYEYVGYSSKVMRNIAIDHKTDTVYWIKYSAHPDYFLNICHLPIK